MKVDHQLITALVERWRTETYTFHLIVGEATITLQDVQVLTGLCVDGASVTGWTAHHSNLANTCFKLLGVSLTETRNAVSGNLITFTWFSDNFSNLPPNANDLTMERYIRGYIMSITGRLLFSDTRGNNVHVMWMRLLEHLTRDGVSSYDWGAAVLANIYWALHKSTNSEKEQMGGYLQPVQVWAYERIKTISLKLKLLCFSQCRPRGNIISLV